ncbi:MAG: DNA repair protein RecO [Dehalococcoidales bacterium]|jgi:DNA repair protein RecO (recombination protein O)|nr:DNA repair protein RecO [Dehalococcoidales bacterium]
MTKPRNYQTEAVIIKKTKLGEADRILALYTPHLGKIHGVAKGVRRPRSKLSGHLELLTHSQISLIRGRNLDTIIGSQTISSFFELKSDLDLTSYALYTIELVNQFTADHIENKPLFRLLLETMQQLCQGGDNKLLLRYFELNLLELVGYRPQLMLCVSCRLPLKPVINSFWLSAGGMLCPSCTQSQPLIYPVSINGLKVLRLLQDCDYTTTGRLIMNQELTSELEQLMRSYLRYLLERELKSAAWLDSLKQLGR